MRIAVISDSYPPYRTGGIAGSHYGLASALTGLGQDVKVFTFVDEFKRRQEQDIFRSGLPRSLIRTVRFTLRSMMRLFGEKGMIYQLGDTLTGAFVGRLLYRHIVAYKPDIVIFPDKGAPVAFWPDTASAKLFMIAHHNPMRFLVPPLPVPHSALDARLAVRVEQLAINRTLGVICPSRDMQDWFKRTYLFSGPVRVIPNLVDPSLVALMDRQLQVDPSKLVVYIPSAGSPLKGSQVVGDLIRAVSARFGRPVEYYLSGEIPTTLIASLPLEGENIRYRMPGNTPYHQNLDQVRTASVCLSPTWIENFSMALLEAQFLGVPVVASRVGGTCEVVEDGVTGYLVTPGNIAEAAERVVDLLCYPEKTAVMQASARASSFLRFHPDQLARQYLEFFQSL